MAKIIQKRLMFDAPEEVRSGDVSDVVSYNIYFSDRPVNYDSAKTNIPAVEGQETYTIAVNGDNTPIREGNYHIGVSSVDAYGNESDIEEIVHPFDFTPPPPVTNLRIE